MKKILSIISIAAVMACNSNTKTMEADVEAKIAAYKDSMRMVADTAGLAQYQAWKAQNELANASQYNAAQPVTVAPSGTNAPARRVSGSRSVNNNGGTINSENSNTAKRKKGWSKAAKGTAIGAGTGAVIGAVVNKKNRVAGGVIGGVVGGGVGYGIGRSMDKKDGRY